MLMLVGVFGVLSLLHRAARSGIGIRMALGASPAQIGRQVPGGACVGRFWGLPWGRRHPRATRGGTQSTMGAATLDSSLLGAVAAAVLLVGVGTSWIPARRAMRVDPVTVLRAE